MTDKNQIGKEVFSADEIERAIAKLAEEINQAFAEQPLTVLCVMTGSVVFCGHLLPKLKSPIQFDYVHATRYGNSNTGSELQWIYTPEKETLNGQTVLIVDDLCDEGITLHEIKNYCLKQGAAEVYIAVLCDKGKTSSASLSTESSGTELQADFIGLHTDDRFLIGFGLDSQGQWRNLPAMYELNDG